MSPDSAARLPDIAAGPEPEAARKRCAPAIVLGYGVGGVAVVLLSGLTTVVPRVPVSAELGLFQLLPPSYWLGLGLIAFSAGLAVWSRSDGLVALTGVLLLATLAGTPTLFEPTPRYWDAYMHFAEAQALGWSGRLPTYTSLYSANWPGAFLVLVTWWGVSGTSALDFLSWYPFVTGGVTFLGIFELLRSGFHGGIARQASVPTALFAVWAQYHVSPQSLGFVVLLLILATFRRRETRWRIVSAGLFVSLVASHPTSAILLLAVLGLYAFFTLIPWFHDPIPKEEFRRDRKFSQRVAVTFAVVWLAWLFFLAVGSSEAAQVAVITKMHTLLGIPEQTLNLATQRTSGDLLNWAPRIRTASIGIYGILGLVSLASLFWDRTSRDRFRLAFSALIAPGLVAVADIFAFGGQFYDRSLLLIAVFAPALCFTGLRRIRLPRVATAGLLGVLVAASAATGATAYYLETFNIVPAEAIAASDFIYDLPSGTLVVDGKYPAPVWSGPGGTSVIIRYTFAQVFPVPLSDWDPGVPVYAVFDPTAELWYRQWYGPGFYSPYADARSNFSLVYDNGWTEVYYIGG